MMQYCNYETFLKGGMPAKYLLRPGELKLVFSKWEILEYREVDEGERAYAVLVARRP